MQISSYLFKYFLSCSHQFYGIAPSKNKILFYPKLENVKLEIPMGKSVLNCTLTATQGKYTFDPVSKTLAWDIGKVDAQKSPNLKGTVNESLILPIH